jgi:hypothetical protein
MWPLTLPAGDVAQGQSARFACEMSRVRFPSSPLRFAFLLLGSTIKLSNIYVATHVLRTLTLSNYNKVQVL